MHETVTKEATAKEARGAPRREASPLLAWGTALAYTLVAAVALADGGTRRPARLVRPSGGLVEKTHGGPILRVVDAQDALPHGQVAAAAVSVRRLSRLPLVAEEARAPGGEEAWRTAQGLARAKGTVAAVLVVDDAELPFLVASPDGRWTILNVAALAGDAAKAPARLERLVWGAASLALGAGVPAPFASLAELDAAPAVPGPAAHNALVDAARARGVGLIALATYRRACEEGWAPAPTNDVQRAIWNQVHAIPDRPMTIEFDPKRDR